MASVEGLAAFKARIEAFSADARAIMVAAVNEGADEMVSAAKASCPTDPTLEDHPGSLKQSIQKHDGSHELIKIVSADAKDRKGRYYGAHVELGHKTPEGGVVPAHPFFYPSWRLVKKRALSRIRSAIRAAAKGEANGEF